MTTVRAAGDATLQLVGRRSTGFSLERTLPDSHYDQVLRRDAYLGLTARHKWLSPMWLYDPMGSMLFEAITEVPEYYPTRAEAEILVANAAAVADRTRARTLVELGSGSSQKTRMLLDALREVGTLRRYVAMDVSESALIQAGQRLAADYPELELTGMVSDFTEMIAPPSRADGPRLFVFLGGSLGNFAPAQRAKFLQRVRAAMGPEDSFLLGVDLVKDPAVLVAAYDDATGVTAAFNRNVLNVLNKQLDADFRPRAFDHVAVWNEQEEWIEMRLRSRRVQTVEVKALDLRVHLGPGEDIRTEISAKFRHSAISAELRAAGLVADQWFSDYGNQFNVYLAHAQEPVITAA